MILNCTKKFQEELGIKAPLIPVEDALFSWHANILRINRRKALVLVQDTSHYQVIVYGLKAKDFKQLDTLIPKAISSVLLSDEVNPQLVDAYLSAGGAFAYSKTQGAKPVARMNKSCELAKYYKEVYTDESLVQTALSRALNYIPFGHDDTYAFPKRWFYRQLHERFALPVFHCKAVVLQVRLCLKHVQVSRKVVVPLRFTFDQLHDIIQILFDWRGYHLHDFTLYHQDEPILNLVGEEDAFDDPSEIPMILEDGIPLSHYLPKCKHLVYCYDYGDMWEHSIDVEDFLFDYDHYYPVCLEGEGDAPPEDVGGEHGYLMYLAIKETPDHEYYDDMKRWAGSQWNATFDLESINRRLQHIYTSTPEQE